MVSASHKIFSDTVIVDRHSIKVNDPVTFTAFPDGSTTLGFDQVTYLGSIENNLATIPAITLSEGFTQNVAFSLYGGEMSIFPGL